MLELTFKTSQQYFDELAQQYIQKHYAISTPQNLTQVILSPENHPFPQGVVYQYGCFDFGTESHEYHFGEQYLKYWVYARSQSFCYEHCDRFGHIYYSEEIKLNRARK